MRTWSYSSLNTFRTCPRQYHLNYVTKVIPYQETEATKWGSEVHTALEQYMDLDVPLTEKYVAYKPYADKILSMPGIKVYEKEYALTKGLEPTEFTDSGAWVRGVIDVAVIDRKRGRAAAFDWKTGKVREGSDQLKLFAAFLFEHYSEVEEVTTGYVWLSHNKVSKEKYTRKDLPAIWQHFMSHAAKLGMAYDKNKWVPKPSGLCNGWCGAGAAHCEFWSPKI